MEAVQESRNNDDDCKGCCHYGGIFDSAIHDQTGATGWRDWRTYCNNWRTCRRILLLDKFGGKTKSAKLGAMSVAMVAMASSALILAGAAAKLAFIDSGKLVSSIVALGSIMGGLTAVSVVLSKTGGKFMKGATGMIAFATAIRIMASAVNAMSGLSWDQMKVGLTGIGILCVELGAFLAASSLINSAF